MHSKIKECEKNRYNRSYSQSRDISSLKQYGPESIDLMFREPYLFYMKKIKECCFDTAKVLDIGSGNGLLALDVVKYCDSLTCIDISKSSIDLINKNANYLNLNVNAIVMDAEKMQFESGVFDIITSSGCLSYFNLPIYIENIKRNLKAGGTLILVDSYNINPIYRLNRFFHFLRGNRSYGVISNMPNKSAIKFLKASFNFCEIRYFGIFAFLAPPLSLFLNQQTVFNIMHNLDKKFSFMKSLSFKFVIILKNN